MRCVRQLGEGAAASEVISQVNLVFALIWCFWAQALRKWPRTGGSCAA